MRPSFGYEGIVSESAPDYNARWKMRNGWPEIIEFGEDWCTGDNGRYSHSLRMSENKSCQMFLEFSSKKLVISIWYKKRRLEVTGWEQTVEL